MTRIKKIKLLLTTGEDIRYHYNTYTHQRRLVIDDINGVRYNSTSSSQSVAAHVIDLMYWGWAKDNIEIKVDELDS